MNAEHVIMFVVIGLVAGLFARKFMKSTAYGLGGDLVVGVFGSFVGAWASGLTGISGGTAFSVLAAGMVGSLLLLFVFRPVRRA